MEKAEYFKVVAGTFQHYSVKRDGIKTREMIQGNIVFCAPVIKHKIGTLYGVVASYPLHSN